MKTLIAYSGKYGTTEKYAQNLAQKLQTETDLCNLDIQKLPDLNQYSRVIAGSAVYAGRIRKPIIELFRNHESTLMQKQFAYFLCGASPQQGQQEIITGNIPESLRSHATAYRYVNGEVHMDKLNFFERKIFGMVAKKTNMPLPAYNADDLEQLAAALN